MIADVVCAMRDFFTGTGCPAKVFLGEAHIAENAEPPRVVWIPTGDRFTPPLQTQAKGVPPAPSYLGSNPRPVLTRWSGAEIHVWAGAGRLEAEQWRQYEKDLAALDALVNQTVLAVHKIVPGYYNFLGADNRQRVHIVNRGLRTVLRVEIAIPIVDIDFPCDAIDTTVFTWLTQGDVVGQITVEELQTPTGPSIGSVTFTTE